MNQAEQITLSWETKLFPDEIRRRFAASASALGIPDAEIGWLFHRDNGRQQMGASVVRFTGSITKTHLTAIGEKACSLIDINMRRILAISRQAGLNDPPRIRVDQCSYARLTHSRSYSINRLALDRIKLGPNITDPSKEELTSRIQSTIANSINSQSEAIGLIPPGLEAGGVRVQMVGDRTLAKVHKRAGGKMSYIPCWGRVIISLPFKLHGEWGAGGLVSRGYGRIKSQSAGAAIAPKQQIREDHQ